MNRSWKNNSSSPPGFVYFNTNNSYQNSASDTSDFLSFGDTSTRGSPKFNRFSPSIYSSPQKFNKSPRNFNNRNSYRYSGGHNRSFNNLNNSFNSSYNNNTRRRESGPQNKRRNGSGVEKDMSRYFDHTSIKNPWAELEENLKKKREAEALENSNNADDKKENLVMENEESSSDSGAEESESESKSSSSGVDEDAT